MTRFRVGDRVQRHSNVMDLTSRLMRGRVIRVYSDTSQFGHYPELYDVEWDHGKTDGGYLPHGLSPLGEKVYIPVSHGKIDD